MPIRPELRKFYGPTWRTVTRPRMLERARRKCEKCGKPNHRRVICRYLGKRMWWSLYGTRWRDHHGRVATPPRFAEVDEQRLVRVVLGVSHLNQVPGDDRDDNLCVMCQWCHLMHDLAQHRETRAARKDRERPLLREDLPSAPAWRLE